MVNGHLSYSATWTTAWTISRRATNIVPISDIRWGTLRSPSRFRPWAGGPARYTISIVRQILLYYHRLPVLDIIIDGEKWGKRRMVNLAVTIGPTTGGGYKFTPGADPFDGRLDVLLMRQMPRLKALRVLPRTKNGGHIGLKEVELVRAGEVEVRCDRPILAHIDGDPIRDKSFTIRIVPGALTVMTPP